MTYRDPKMMARIERHMQAARQLHPFKLPAHERLIRGLDRAQKQPRRVGRWALARFLTRVRGYVTTSWYRGAQKDPEKLRRLFSTRDLIQYRVLIGPRPTPEQAAHRALVNAAREHLRLIEDAMADELQNASRLLDAYEAVAQSIKRSEALFKGSK